MHMRVGTPCLLTAMLKMTSVQAQSLSTAQLCTAAENQVVNYALTIALDIFALHCTHDIASFVFPGAELSAQIFRWLAFDKLAIPVASAYHEPRDKALPFAVNGWQCGKLFPLMQVCHRLHGFCRAACNRKHRVGWKVSYIVG